jgi:hypothetical protein
MTDIETYTRKRQALIRKYTACKVVAQDAARRGLKETVTIFIDKANAHRRDIVAVNLLIKELTE